MKNLFTLLLLVVSLLAVGQTNNTTEEIKYWKSIADSNDTVAYRQYLNRYGETGLYHDEAITRIALLKTSGKQAQSKSTECCFYDHYVVKFDSNQDKVWIKLDYDIRSNLVLSREFYESQATIAMSRESINLMAHSRISGKITDDNKSTLSGATVVATHKPSGTQYHTMTNASGNYYLCNIRPDGPYTIEYRMVGFQTVKQKGVTATLGRTKILNVIMNEKSGEVSIVADSVSLEPENYKYAWTVDEEYEYDPIKSTSARDVYFKRDNLHIIDCYITYSYEYEKLLGKKHDSYKSYKYDDEYDEKHYKNGDSNDAYHYSNNTKVGVYTIHDPAYHYSYNIKTMQGYRYVAFSKDKSSIIMWFEEDNKYNNGTIQNKEEFNRRSKESFLPTPVNYDFLNE